ncbi:hypothetical protein [Acidaminococcus sp.]|uniref:hypothetical protein n=1 Tax=Acidaminococcus sp. TaxID=1872103 RepID=UPI003D7C53ED
MARNNFSKASPANKPGSVHRMTNVAEQALATAALLRAKADDMTELAVKLARIARKSRRAENNYKRLHVLLDDTIRTLAEDREWLERYWAAEDLYPEWGAAVAARSGKNVQTRDKRR